MQKKKKRKYQSVKCLINAYKMITSILKTIVEFIEHNKNFGQKICKKESYGYKDQLLINKMIMETSRSKQKNLSMAWIDYDEAFDIIPHKRILKVLNILKLSPIIITFQKYNLKR